MPLPAKESPEFLGISDLRPGVGDRVVMFRWGWYQEIKDGNSRSKVGGLCTCSGGAGGRARCFPHGVSFNPPRAPVRPQSSSQIPQEVSSLPEAHILEVRILPGVSGHHSVSRRGAAQRSSAGSGASDLCLLVTKGSPQVTIPWPLPSCRLRPNRAGISPAC